MATRKTTAEKRQELIEKQKQIQAQIKAYDSRLKQEERKKRTKMLIEIGGTVVKALGRDIPHEDLPKLYNFLMQQEERGKFFSRAMEHDTYENHGAVTAPNHDE